MCSALGFYLAAALPVTAAPRDVRYSLTCCDARQLANERYLCACQESADADLAPASPSAPALRETRTGPAGSMSRIHALLSTHYRPRSASRRACAGSPARGAPRRGPSP